MDCVAAYTCVRESPALTVPQMETFFQKHLQNRATCSSSGPSNLWDYATAYTILTGVVQTSVTRSQLKKNPFSSNNPFAGSNQRGNHTVQFQHISGSNISNGSHFRNQRGKPKGNRGVGKRGGGQNSAQGNNHVANPAQVVTPPFFPFPSCCPDLLNTYFQLTSTLAGRNICLNFNRGKTCPNVAADGSQCTKKNGQTYWHICARVKANGKACGSNNHNAMTHH